MKATIDASGMLSIIPENEVEAYAIRCYMEKFNSDNPPAIRFAWDTSFCVDRAEQGEVEHG